MVYFRMPTCEARMSGYGLRDTAHYSYTSSSITVQSLVPSSLKKSSAGKQGNISQNCF